MQNRKTESCSGGGPRAWEGLVGRVMEKGSRKGRQESVLRIASLCRISLFQISTRPLSTAPARFKPTRGGRRSLRSPATLRMSHSASPMSVVALNSLVRIFGWQQHGVGAERPESTWAVLHFFSLLTNLSPVHLSSQDQPTFSLLPPPLPILFLSPSPTPIPSPSFCSGYFRAASEMKLEQERITTSDLRKQHFF